MEGGGEDRRLQMKRIDYVVRTVLPSSSSEKDAVRSLPTELDRFFTDVITEDFNNPPPCPCP